MNTQDMKHIDPAALACLTTGILLTDFSRLHEAAEWVLGHPVWTHQFPSIADKMRDAVLAQFPDMPTTIDGSQWETIRDNVRKKYGTLVAVKRGDNPAISQFEYLPEAEVIVCEVK